MTSEGTPAHQASSPAAVAPEAAAPARRPAFAALGQHDFRLLLLMQAASGVRQPMLFFTQAWYVSAVAPESQRIFLLGLLGAIRGAVFLAYAAFGGVIADRFPRRTTLLISHGVALSLSTGIGLLLYMPAVSRGDGPWLWILMLLFASFGLITGQDQPTRTAMIRDAVPASQVTSAVTLNQLALSLAFLPAAPFAGWSLAHLGFATTYLVAASGHFVVIGALMLLRLPDRPADPAARGSSLISNLRDGLVVLRDDPVVRWTILLTWLVLIAGLSVMGILIAAWVRDVLRLDATGWGVMALFWGVGGILANAWLMTRGEYRRMGALFLGAAALMGVAVTAFGLSRSIPPAFFFNGLAGLAHALVLTVSVAIVQRAVPNRLLGRVTALLMLSNGLMQLAALAIGVLGQLLGLEVVYPAAGLVILAAAALTTARQRPLRAMR